MNGNDETSKLINHVIGTLTTLADAMTEEEHVPITPTELHNLAKRLAALDTANINGSAQWKAAAESLSADRDAAVRRCARAELAETKLLDLVEDMTIANAKLAELSVSIRADWRRAIGELERSKLEATITIDELQSRIKGGTNNG